MSGEPELSRADYRHFLEIPTRWMDNDVYGHVNNVEYYSYFDTVVNQYLIENGGLDYLNGETVGFVVETRCAYKRPIAFPDVVEAGIRVARIGTSSVTYEVGLFKKGQEAICAFGHFVHVYVDRATNKSAPIPERARAAMEAIKAG
ncbi:MULTISPECIES: acyl-CoA thioesterase [Thalassobaculum]|uniref:Acyl-CoA thioester hydrolase n=1 Tax=Thalassobaculum litoreum DSM 18839 TaxID=1123362 RepID=A0A8G2BK39_9PROT|nr:MULTISPECIES: thioesterase family protein [Thalassobaculum]SDF93811.1 acyl-CoA thioester hydrolase [Thalassobaculum litoreum DSM 18839]